MSGREYDVVIVGAGPAGVFCALELSSSNGLRIALLEKGKPLEQRSCPARQAECIRCAECDITTGFGGAGAFSDGKLTLTPDVGGWLAEFVGRETLSELIGEADAVWLEHGANPQVHEPDPAERARLSELAATADMRLVPMRIRHIGTDRAPEVLGAMRERLEERGVDIRTGAEVASVLLAGEGVRGVELADGTHIEAGTVVIAPGREGSDWLAEQAQALGIGLAANAVDIGVRVEVPSGLMEPLTDHLYEAKLIYRSKRFEDEVRTFCMNPYGEVTTESYGEIVTVNGHSYAEKRTGYTNFAVLVSQRFTQPFDEPITYGNSVARLANLLGSDIIVQRLGDLTQGRRSTPERIAAGATEPTLVGATPGDLAFVLPYRHLADILEFLHALDAIVPGVAAPDTLLYGVEVKFYSSRVEVDEGLATRIPGLYAIGDGAGITRGLIQSSASGMVAARSILGGR